MLTGRSWVPACGGGLNLGRIVLGSGVWSKVCKALGYKPTWLDRTSLRDRIRAAKIRILFTLLLERNKHPAIIGVPTLHSFASKFSSWRE